MTTSRTLDCNLPPCPPGKEYGFTVTGVHNTLLTYIRSHGFPCRFQDGKIRAAVRYNYVNRFTGATGGFWQIDTIELTLSAVRTWLGY